MFRNHRRSIVGGLIAVLILAFAGVAGASVTFNPATGTGFVGKGDVQTALGMNNAQLQAAASSLSFTYRQPASQALSQSATQQGTQAGSQSLTQSGSQSATQSGSQSMSELLTCRKTNGAVAQQNRTGVRDGERTGSRIGSRSGSRDGIRNGSRDGSRTGSRSGVLSGTLTSTVSYDPRVRNQITGFNLTGKGAASFASSGDPVWNSPTFGAYSYGTFVFGDPSFGDYSFGDPTFGSYTFGDVVTWGAWDTDGTNAEPDVCLNSSGQVNANVDPTSIVHTVTAGAVSDGAIVYGATTDGAVSYGDVTEGTVTDGAITYGAITYGAVTPSGSATLFVNGVQL